jgi:cytochrome P450
MHSFASIAPPADALAAPSHPDPYPWYRQLAADQPVGFDASLRLWVVAGGAACREALRHSDLRVRPANELVPTVLLGTKLGALWREWARMNDGREHAIRSQAIREALESLAPEWIERAAAGAAGRLAPLLERGLGPAGVDGFVGGLPALGTALAMGFDPQAAESLAAAAAELVHATAAGVDAEARAEGERAAARLMTHFEDALGTRDGSTLPAKLAAAMPGAGAGLAAAVANSIALLFQSHDATAGWIGNALVALARSPVERERLARDPVGLRECALRVLMSDPPVHNTRRFAASDLSVLGASLRAGDGVLVVLGSAPELTFGNGAHRCPGSGLAATLVRAALETALRSAIDWPSLARPAYRPLPNVRVPRFAAEDPS